MLSCTNVVPRWGLNFKAGERRKERGNVRSDPDKRLRATVSVVIFSERFPVFMATRSDSSSWIPLTGCGILNSR